MRFSKICSRKRGRGQDRVARPSHTREDLGSPLPRACDQTDSRYAIANLGLIPITEPELGYRSKTASDNSCTDSATVVRGPDETGRLHLLRRRRGRTPACQGRNVRHQGRHARRRKKPAGISRVYPATKEKVMRPDDSLLDSQQLAVARRHVDLLLRDAAALGRFPTPIDDILEAANLTVVDNEELDEGLLHQFLSKAKSGIANIKSALSKILGMFESNDRLVFIDRNAPKPRIPFIKLHEAGH